MSLSFTASNDLTIQDNDLISYKKMNHIIDVKSCKFQNNNLNKIKKINKNEYVDITTGQIKQYNLSDKKSENIESLKKTFSRLRDLINNNFQGLENEVHLVLTYKENMQCNKRLYSDVDIFLKKWKYWFGKNYEYINVIEPQGRGAWHCHLLIKESNYNKLYIPWQKIKKIWTHGNIHINKLNNIDNIGMYLSAYFTDIETNVDFNKTVNNKRYKKGGRLHLYPKDMKLYRHSKNIKPPEICKATFKEFKKNTGLEQPAFCKNIKVYKDNKLINEINYLNYNTKKNIDNC